MPLDVLAALIQNRMALRDEMTHSRQRIELPHWSTWYPQEPRKDRDYALGDLQLLTVEQVAADLRVSVTSVYRFSRYHGLAGRLPITTKARRYLASEVSQWLNSRVALSLRISGELPPRASRRRKR